MTKQQLLQWLQAAQANAAISQQVAYQAVLMAGSSDAVAAQSAALAQLAQQNAAGYAEVAGVLAQIALAA